MFHILIFENKALWKQLMDPCLCALSDPAELCASSALFVGCMGLYVCGGADSGKYLEM